MGRFVPASNDVRRVTHRSARAYYVVLLSITQHSPSQWSCEGVEGWGEELSVDELVGVLAGTTYLADGAYTVDQVTRIHSGEHGQFSFFGPT